MLCLDGGGIMGAFTASALATLEEATGERLVDHFDLIAGTSTGGIIAIALGMGQTARQVCDFYTQQGPKIFPSGGPLGGWLKGVRHLLRPKFSPVPLREAITAVTSQRPLHESTSRLVVPAYNVDLGRVWLFKTPHTPLRTGDGMLPAVDVALATSAAPTYFPAHHIPGQGTFIDGGVWANCPAAVGVTEAVRFLGQDLHDIWVLSVSTTNYPFHISSRARLGGILGWNKTLIDTLMFGQAEGSLRYAQNLVGGPISDGGRFHRIDFVAAPSIYSIDNVRVVRELIETGAATAGTMEHLHPIRKHFLNGKPATKFFIKGKDKYSRSGGSGTFGTNCSRDRRGFRASSRFRSGCVQSRRERSRLWSGRSDCSCAATRGRSRRLAPRARVSTAK